MNSTTLASIKTRTLICLISKKKEMMTENLEIEVNLEVAEVVAEAEEVEVDSEVKTEVAIVEEKVVTTKEADPAAEAANWPTMKMLSQLSEWKLSFV